MVGEYNEVVGEPGECDEAEADEREGAEAEYDEATGESEEYPGDWVRGKPRRRCHMPFARLALTSNTAAFSTSNWNAPTPSNLQHSCHMW